MAEYDELIRIIDDRESFLEKMITQKHSTVDRKDGRFLVARKWNSWYPSYFDVEGGCYAIITREPISGDNDPGIIIVDPGFKFLKILKQFEIEPINIKNVVVTHFHPDHIAGLEEFLTQAFKSNQKCTIYLNPTSYEVFKIYEGKNIIINELKPEKSILLAEYNTKNGKEKIRLRSHKANHREIGNRNNALSLAFEIQTRKNNGELKNYNVGILGDTDGSEKYLETYVKNFQNMDILCLHVGSFTEKKYGSGYGHLYAPGTMKLLEKLNSAKKFPLIILSEFGLEMGTRKQIANSFEPLVEAESWKIPLRIAEEIINNPSTETEDRKVLRKLYAKHVDVFFLWMNQPTPESWQNTYWSSAQLNISKLIDFCSAILFSLILTKGKKIFLPKKEDLIKQYEDESYKKGDKLSKECETELEALKAKSPLIPFLRNEIPNPEILGFIAKRLFLIPPSVEASNLTWGEEIMKRFPITREFWAITNWDQFLIESIGKMADFCSRDLGICEKIKDCSPDRLRSGLFIGLLMLYESLKIPLPATNFRLGSTDSLEAESTHLNELMESYQQRHNTVYNREESPIFKAYRLLKSKYPKAKIIPGDMGIQFKLAETITIRANELSLKPWLNFGEIKIFETNGKIRIGQNKILCP